MSGFWFLLAGLVLLTGGQSVSFAALPSWSIGRYVIMYVNVGEEDEESAVIRIDNFGKDNYLYPTAWNNINHWWRVHLGDAGSGVMFINTRVVPPAGAGTNGTGVNLSEVASEDWHGWEIYDQTVEGLRVVILGFDVDAGPLPGGDPEPGEGSVDVEKVELILCAILGVIMWNIFRASASRRDDVL